MENEPQIKKGAAERMAKETTSDSSRDKSEFNEDSHTQCTADQWKSEFPTREQIDKGSPKTEAYRVQWESLIFNDGFI